MPCEFMDVESGRRQNHPSVFGWDPSLTKHQGKQDKQEPNRTDLCLGGTGVLRELDNK